MKTFLAVVALGALAFFGFKMVQSGGFPQGTLSRVAEAPGTAVSRIQFSGGNLPMILMVVGGVVLLILALYMFMRK